MIINIIFVEGVIGIILGCENDRSAGYGKEILYLGVKIGRAVSNEWHIKLKD